MNKLDKDEQSTLLEDVILILKRQHPEYVDSFINSCISNYECRDCPDVVCVLCQKHFEKSRKENNSHCRDFWREAALLLRRAGKDKEYEK